MKPFVRETVIDRRQPFLRWSPIFGGAIFAIGLWMLLQVLGIGAGLAAVDTNDAGSLKGAGIGTGIWSIIAPLIAMFVGGLLAGRTSGTRDRKVGAMHASVMWALALGVGLWALMSVVSSLAGGVGRVAGAAGNATSSVVSAVANNSDAAMNALGIDANDMLGPINERLRKEGKPTITADQMSATMKALAQRGVRQGHMDREVVVQEVARNTNLSRPDAEEVANDLERKYQDVSTKAGAKLDEVGEQAKHVGLEAADKTGKVLLLGGLMMLLSLGAAIAGGALGVPRMRDEEYPIITSTTPTEID
jgi:hypothetical protein